MFAGAFTWSSKPDLGHSRPGDAGTEPRVAESRPQDQARLLNSNIYLEVPPDSMLRCCAQDALAVA